jgi:site-specific DNA-methyltransferase (adenine-specific)
VILYLGDFRTLVRQMPNASVDCIIADPPYGETSLAWDRWVADWPSEVHRVLKPTGSMWVFGSMRMFLAHVPEFRRFRFAQDVVWEKHNGSGFHADRFKRVHEHALQFYKIDVPWAGVYKSVQYTLNATARAVRRKRRPTHMGHIESGSYTSEDGGPRMMRSVLYVRSEHGRAEHPTQKPEGIVEPLLRFSCLPGGVVLDPFMGSGTTGIVAGKNGMRFIGAEANPDYFEIAKCRIWEASEGGAVHRRQAGS